jgi:hypothetical protein
VKTKKKPVSVDGMDLSTAVATAIALLELVSEGKGALIEDRYFPKLATAAKVLRKQVGIPGRPRPRQGVLAVGSRLQKAPKDAICECGHAHKRTFWSNKHKEIREERSISCGSWPCPCTDFRPRTPAPPAVCEACDWDKHLGKDHQKPHTCKGAKP